MSNKYLEFLYKYLESLFLLTITLFLSLIWILMQCGGGTDFFYCLKGVVLFLLIILLYTSPIFLFSLFLSKRMAVFCSLSSIAGITIKLYPRIMELLLDWRSYFGEAIGASLLFSILICISALMGILGSFIGRKIGIKKFSKRNDIIIGVISFLVLTTFYYFLISYWWNAK